MTKKTDAMELLAPAGSFESMQAAFHAGADAVYMGGPRFGARAYADNPDDDGVKRAIDYTHLRGKKLYLTVNTLLKNSEIGEELYDYLKPLYETGLDAVIIQDFGVFRFLREAFPDLPLHGSTQMTVCGPEGAALLKAQGLKRLVLPRELSLQEIRLIWELDVEIDEIEASIQEIMDDLAAEREPVALQSAWRANAGFTLGYNRPVFGRRPKVFREYGLRGICITCVKAVVVITAAVKDYPVKAFVGCQFTQESQEKLLHLRVCGIKETGACIRIIHRIGKS